MSKQVLYIKWRPKTFKDIIGQNNIIEYIKNSIFLNKIHHSYLFIGNKGVGKTTIARLFVKCLNCSSIKKILNEENYNFPCNICNNCLLINNNKFIDFIEIDAANKSGIDDIKELLNGIQYLPIISKYKIYLIDEIHMLSKQGFSALLKTLEEPPSYIKFILATTEIKKIPDTILSRCMIFNLNEISIEDIVNRLIFILNKENINYEIDALYLIANFSKGSIRDALNITEKSFLIENKNNISLNTVNNILGMHELKLLIDIIYSIINNDINLLINCLNKNELYFINYENIFIQILTLIHNIYMININYKYIINIMFLKYKNEIYNLFSKCNLLKLRKMHKNFLKILKELHYYTDNKIGFESSIINLFFLVNKNELIE